MMHGVVQSTAQGLEAVSVVEAATPRSKKPAKECLRALSITSNGTTGSNGKL
jgi:hypothetical protein